MRGWLLTVGSILLTGLVIGNAYYQKQQFYPSVVYITKSNPSLAVLYLQAFVFVLLIGQLSRKVFFGQLRPAETEHLIERSWYAVTETCLAFTVFRDNFSPLFVAQFTLLLFLKCFHWLSEDRIEYMERSPVITFLFHIRAISLLTSLGTLDSLFIHKAYRSVLSSGASTQLVFGFEYAILLSMVVAVLMKYVLHTIDLQSDNPWENKAVYILYSELVMGFIKSLLYITFMFIMIRVHTFPLFAIRPMYLTLRYPDATAEELGGGDNVCIICREEMVTNCKKLPCNHIFHANCLRSWFQRQQTCPTCRMDVLQPRPREAQQAPPVPQPQGVPPMHGPAHMPPPFPMFPLGFPPVPPPGLQGGPGPAAPPPRPPSGPTSAGVPAAEVPPTTANQATSSISSNTNPSTFPFIPPFPMVFPPPMFGFPFPPAASQINPNLSTFSPEELRSMEGQERQNVEARITMLRNIHSLLDSAIVQLNQYSQLVTAQTVPSHSRESAPRTTPSTVESTGSGDSVPLPETVLSENIVGSSTDTAGPSWAMSKDDSLGEETPSSSTQDNEPSPFSQLTVDSSASVEDGSAESQNDIRRRRIQRFSSEPNAVGDQD